MTTPTNLTPNLPDADARASIVSDLDHNLVVEAAAGTGKTTCLVARICELIQAGALRDNARFAAVTFTIKAANELKQRLQAEIERQRNTPKLDPGKRELLSASLHELAECHIGTIHSFCARLLRERPVEAGVNPDFQELDQDRDDEYRQRAWKEFARRLDAGQHAPLTEAFRVFGLDMDTLGAGFLNFAEYPDVDQWVGSNVKMRSIDFQAFVRGLDDFTNSLGNFAPQLENADPGNDSLIPILQVVNRRKKRPALKSTEDAYRLSALFSPKAKPAVRHWTSVFAFKPEEIEKRKTEYAGFYDNVVKPFRAQCQAAVYGAAMAAYKLTQDIYDRLRREDGVLNFQDLLLSTARVLRNHPDVRQDLAARFQRLLVDEVQDTDPVQAEILLLLAGTDTDVKETDWRRVVPRPGSLFIVGDPKQSIYRFRRADIVVYQELKDMVTENGGRLLELTANFRSEPAVLDWVNETFSLPSDDNADNETVAKTGKFSFRNSPYSPAYVPLTPGKNPTAEECLKGVYCLETIAAKKGKVGIADILADESARIAGFIRDALDNGRRVPDRGGVRTATPGDFMIVTYQKATAPLYAAALGRLGIESEVSAGGALAASPVLDMLSSYLVALANPDDPVAALAVLRGPLFGVSDQELYRWKKADGSFLLPYARDGEPRRVARALRLMREHHRLFVRLDPVSCLNRIVDDLGLWALSCLGDDPDAGAGALFTALELLKAGRNEIAGPGGLAARLQWVRGKYDGDVIPPRPPDGQAVRIMNVHKTKGLEAPIVFLACTRNLRTRPARFAVNRGGGKVEAGMLLAGGEFGNITLACPLEWETLAEREELFLQAERTRLNYVAATRAGSMLVVSVHQSSKAYKSAFLPGGDAGALMEHRLPEPECAPVPRRDTLPEEIDAERLEHCAGMRREGLAAALSGSYRLERAKPDAHAADFMASGVRVAEEGTDPELAADLGEILHRLLETGSDKEAMTEQAAQLLGEYGLPLGMAAELAHKAAVVRRSEIWRRAAAAEHCFRELPFTIAGIEGEGDQKKNVVRRGVIDLVFQESGGWVIVDYKSDRIAPHGDCRKAAAKHAAQLHAYAGAWEKAVGGKVVDALVFFVHEQECVSVLKP